MSFRIRMLVLITLLLTGAVFVTASILTWNTYQALLEQQREAGEVVVRILARTAYLVQNFPIEMENAIAEQMVTEATITAHFVDAAEQAGWTPDEINSHLQQIVANTTLSEFWVTDEKGHAYLRNADNIDFTFDPDPTKNPQSYIFYDLLTGKQNVVIQAATRRDYDGKVFKYVGVGGVDKARIVQVGYEASVLEESRQRVSLDRLSRELVSGGDIRAIRVVGQGLETQVFQAGPGVSKDMTSLDRQMLENVVERNQEQAYVEDRFLKVIEPIRGTDANGPVAGAVIIYLPTDHLQAAIQREVAGAALAALVILLAGMVMSVFMSQLVTRPVQIFQRAATSLQAGSYRPELLRDVIARKDEIGHLGVVFDRMAREVGARDRHLKLLRVIIPIGVALSAEKDFSRLMETIVIEAQRITSADAGSLYLRTDDNMLRFVILRNESLGMVLGGTTGKEVTLKPVPMYDEQGKPNHNNLASYSALTGKRILLDDAYLTSEFDLSGTRAFDAQTGYHSKSFLTMPLKDTSDKVIGVLQLINAKDSLTNEIIPFEEDEILDFLALITSAALSAYIRDESMREEINKLRIEVDLAKQNKQVDEIAESDYFKNLQVQAELMRKKRKS
jgi:HAMP domain-containing protein